MIPILFDSTETSFQSNGVGRLRDCIKCVVTEERNGQFECEFKYPITGKYYHDIVEGMYVYCIHDDTKTPQAFEIYSRSAPMNGIVTFHARHISYKLNNIVVNPFSATTVAEAFAKINDASINANPFTFWTDKSTTANFKLLNPASVRSILGGVQGSILDVYGGEYKFDMLTVRLYTHRGQDTDVTIRYGKNLTDIEQSLDNGETYDAAVPYWRQEENVVILDERIVKPTSRNKQDRLFALDLSGKFQNAPTQAQLKSAAQSYVDSNKPWIPEENIKINFIQLWQTEEYKDVAVLQRVSLCDTVNVYYPALGITAEGVKVIKTEYDVLLERYEKMELGDARSSFGDTIMKKANDALTTALTGVASKSFLEEAIEHATQLITGGLGGYVVMKTDANDKPTEILIMDTDDENTAVHVLRLNVNGIGFSSTGINGPYTNAWTLDGHLVADFIDTGTLNANIIRAGILTDFVGTNYWNLATGEFQLASTTTVGGQTVAAIAEDAADDAVDSAMTQQNIFNKLTNNGETQGIYLSNGKLYINATYIKTGTLSANMISGGTLQDTQGNIVWNLSTGAMTAKNLSIDSTNFKLTSAGVMSATGADINGTITSVENQWFARIKKGSLEIGYYDSSTSTFSRIGYIHPIDTTRGVLIQSEGDYFNIVAAKHLSIKTNDTTNGTITFNGAKVTMSKGASITSGASISGGLTVTGGLTASGEITLGTIVFSTGDSTIAGIKWSSGAGIRLNGDQIILGSGAVMGGGYQTRICGDAYVDGSVTQSSDERKKNIEECDENVDALVQELKPIKFTWKDSADKKTHFGLGAQTTERLLKEHDLEDAALVQHIDDNYGINYSELAPMLLVALQKDREKINELEDRIAKLEALVAQLAK